VFRAPFEAKPQPPHLLPRYTHDALLKHTKQVNALMRPHNATGRDSGTPRHLWSESESRYDRRSVGQSVLVSSPIWGSWPDINYCLTVTVVSISGAPSDDRQGLSSVLVTWTASVHCCWPSPATYILTAQGHRDPVGEINLLCSYKGEKYHGYHLPLSPWQQRKNMFPMFERCN
jgi:hypothetical protein